jgi:hypothetical protein
MWGVADRAVLGYGGMFLREGSGFLRMALDAELPGGFGIEVAEVAAVRVMTAGALKLALDYGVMEGKVDLHALFFVAVQADLAFRRRRVFSRLVNLVALGAG